MSELTKFRDHCRAMAATGAHLPECDSLKRRITVLEAHFCGIEPFEPPECAGCVPEGDRDLFARMAAEVDDYLAPQPDLFGAETVEPDATKETA